MEDQHHRLRGEALAAAQSEAEQRRDGALGLLRASARRLAEAPPPGLDHELGVLFGHAHAFHKASEDAWKLIAALDLHRQERADTAARERRSCLDCDNIYRGDLECPACGNHSGEPLNG